LWFSSIDSFSRVHDKKLSIAAIVALLNLDASQVPMSVQMGWPRLLQGVVSLFRTLPAATANREEALKDDFPLDDGTYDDDEDDEWAGDDNAWAEDAETEELEGDAKDESAAYLEFLNEEAQKFSALGDDDDDDDDLGEESLLETPLDKLEPYQLFRDSFLKLQQTQPELYQQLTTNLNPDEQTVIQSVVQQAEVNAQQALAMANAAQAAQPQ